MAGIWDNGENHLPSGLYTPQRKKLPWTWINFGGFIVLSFILTAFFSVHYGYAGRIFKLGELPQKHVGIVLGAGVKPDGKPSDALMDRLLTGADLHRYGIVKYLLVTGDDGQYHSGEVSVMKRTLIDLGVPENVIYVDPHGYRTYESCKRAIDVFRVNEAIVVTQRFHLPRALFLCNELGLESIGISADRQTYQRQSYYEFREFFASVKAFIDIYIHNPSPPVKYPAGE